MYWTGRAEAAAPPLWPPLNAAARLLIEPGPGRAAWAPVPQPEWAHRRASGPGFARDSDTRAADSSG